MSKIDKILYICMGIIIASSSMFMSCTPIFPSNKTVVSPTDTINTTNQDIAGSTTTLTGTTAKIQADATSGMAATPVAAQPVLTPKWQDILVQAGIQQGVVNDLKQIQVQLTSAQSQSKQLEAEYNTSQTNLAKAQASTAAADHAKFTWTIIAFVVVGVINLAAIFSGYLSPKLDKLAIGVGVACLAGTVTCIALLALTSIVTAIMPYVVGGIAIVGIGVVVYYLYSQRKAITTAVTANKKLTSVGAELVHSFEAVKPLMSMANRKLSCGDAAMPGFLHTIQSADTREFVANVRSQMTNIAPSIPETIASDLVQADVSHDGEPSSPSDVLSQKPDTKSIRSRRCVFKPGASTTIILR